MKKLLINSIVVVVIISAISAVESTWLMNRQCNGTDIESWATYINGDCTVLLSTGSYGICTGAKYYQFNCGGSDTCHDCKISDVQEMNECDKHNNYFTCSSGEPDFSAFGSSYIKVQVYVENGCAGKVHGMVAAPINKCLNGVVSNMYKSVYISCSKDGHAKMDLFLAADCQHIGHTMNVDTNTCSSTPDIPMPFVATCVGF